MSRIDNQIVTLSARSPDNALSGCTIVPKNPIPLTTRRPATTETPIEFTTLPDNESEIAATETIYDKFLRHTTIIPKNDRDGKSLDNNTENNQNNESTSEAIEQFNDTEVFNATSEHGSRNGGGLYFKHDVGFENELENTTEYKTEVEELFEPHKKSDRIDYDESALDERQRRSNPPLTARPARETYIVRCHNAGSFISSRERWWFIAIANCGSSKGLDVKYKFKMTNGNTGDFWHEHFSADERRKFYFLNNAEFLNIFWGYLKKQKFVY